MKRWIFILPVILLIGIVAIFVQGLDPNRDPSALPSALIGKPAPSLALPGINPGDPGLKIDDFKGQVIAVNFFASWCVPCRAEHPLLERLTEQLNIPVIGVDYKDKPEKATAFLKELGNPFRAVGADNDGMAAINYGITGVPETFIVDKGGIVRYRHTGPLTQDVIDSELAPLIKDLQK